MAGAWELPLLPDGDTDPPWPQAQSAIHLDHLHTGKLLMWNYGTTPNTTNYQTPEARLWTPPAFGVENDAGTFESVPNTHTNLFCAGHCQLDDGRVFCSGGDFHPNDPDNDSQIADVHTDIFDPDTETWSDGPDMEYPRWYPTCTRLANGKVLITLGESSFLPQFLRAKYPELVQPGSPNTISVVAQLIDEGSYPYIFVLPDGRIFYSGGASVTKVLAANLTGGWQSLGTNTNHPEDADGTAVMYRPGKVLKIGGGFGSDDPSSAVATVSRFDSTATTPQWQNVASMAFPRINHNAVLLPNGTVLVVGGHYEDGTGYHAVLEAEIYDPDSNTWTTQASMTIPRRYHSTAMLLPDGRVAVAGGEPNPNDPPYRFDSAQIFRPSYFDGDPDRPVIDSAPNSLEIGSEDNEIEWSGDGSQTIKAVNLLALGCVTHGFDQNQRFVPLEVQSQTSSLVKFKGPLSANHAPPGWYMLFLVNTQNIPSKLAAYVRVKA